MLNKHQIIKSQNIFKSIFYQLKLSIKIDLKNKIRLILLILIPFFAGIIISLIVRYSTVYEYSYYFNKNIPVWILIIIVTAVFIGLVSSAHEFIFMRNFHNIENILINKNFSLSISKILKYIILSFIQSFLLIFPATLLLNIFFHFAHLFFFIWMLILWGSLVSLLLSKLFKNVSTIYLIIPLIIIPQMIFSGALIPFENFNKNIPKYGDIPIGGRLMPIRWASEAIITDFFINNNYEKNIFQEKQLFYEANYYLYFVLPEIQQIFLSDSINAKNIFININEFKNKNFKNKNFLEKIEILKQVFNNQRINSQKQIDNKLSSIDIEIFKLKYTNKAIDDILLNNYKSINYTIKNNKIERKYTPIYSISSSFYENSTFLIGTKKIFNSEIETYFYNLLIIIVQNLIILISIIFRYEFKESHAKK